MALTVQTLQKVIKVMLQQRYLCHSLAWHVRNVFHHSLSCSNTSLLSALGDLGTFMTISDHIRGVEQPGF